MAVWVGDLGGDKGVGNEHSEFGLIGLSERSALFLPFRLFLFLGLQLQQCISMELMELCDRINWGLVMLLLPCTTGGLKSVLCLEPGFYITKKFF